MRLFEVLLILINFYLIFVLGFGKNRASQKLLITSGIGTFILLLHLTYEGLRWQLFIPYCSTLLCLGIFTYTCLRKAKVPRGSKKIKNISTIILTIGMLLSTLVSILLPVFHLPKTTGEYEVGTQTFYFIDNGREERYTKSKDDKRELMVQVWYPAGDISNKNHSYMISDGKAFLKECAQGVKIPEFLIDYLAYIKSNSYEDCDISSLEDTYPLIIMNHGLGTSRYFQVSQAEELASHGYIVASIDHTYKTMATLFPDGRVTHFISEDMDSYYSSSKAGEEWTKDILYTIDQFELFNSGELNSFFTGRIDMSNIGTMGHSFGGAAAYDSCYDDRIKAGINEDGTLYGYKDKEYLTKPFLFIYSEQAMLVHNMASPVYNATDIDLENMGVSRTEYEAAQEDLIMENKQIEATAQSGGYILHIGDTTHYNFTDLQLISPLLRVSGLLGKIEGRRASYIVNQYALDFFDKYLKGDNGSLLGIADNKYPEVKFITSMFDEALLK